MSPHTPAAPPRARRLRAALSAALSAPLCALSCDAPLPPATLADGYRVLGISAAPPVARPHDKVTFTLYDHHPAGVEMLYVWSVCLYSYGAAAGFECAQPDLQELVVSEASPRLTLDLGPEGLNLKGKLPTFSTLRDVDGRAPSLERGHDIYIVVASGLPGDSRGEVRTVKRLRVIDDGQGPGAPPLGENPLLEGWTLQPSTFAAAPCARDITGPLDPRAAGFLEVGRALLDAEVSGAGEVCVVEAGATLDVSLRLAAPLKEGLYEWLSDEGSYAAPQWTTGAEGRGRFRLPNRSGPLDVYFTARDEAGGFAVGRQSLFLIPNQTTTERR